MITRSADRLELYAYGMPEDACRAALTAVRQLRRQDTQLARMRRKLTWMALAIVAIVALFTAACEGPMVRVLPGTYKMVDVDGRRFYTFELENGRSCTMNLDGTDVRCAR